MKISLICGLLHGKEIPQIEKEENWSVLSCFVHREEFQINEKDVRMVNENFINLCPASLKC